MAKKNTETVENFDDILDRSWDDIPEAVTLPGGQYLLKGRNAVYTPPKEEGQSGKVLFFLTPKEPIAGEVDEDALAALGEDYDYSVNEVVYTVWIESMRSWGDVRKVLAMFGIEGGNIRQSLKEIRNREVVGNLDTRTYTNSLGQLVEQNVVTSFQSIND